MVRSPPFLSLAPLVVVSGGGYGEGQAEQERTIQGMAVVGTNSAHNGLCFPESLASHPHLSWTLWLLQRKPPH